MGLSNEIEELLERNAALIYNNLVVNRETFRDCFHGTAHYGVVILAFCLFDVVRLAKHKKRKRQVDEGVPKFFDGVESLNKLVNFDANYTSDHCGGCSDCRDNFACDHLRLSVVAFSDLVVTCSEAGNSVDEVNVEICVIVFFKLCTLDLGLANNLRVIGQRTLNFNQLAFIIFRSRLLRWGFFSRLSCLYLFGCLNFNQLRNVGFAGNGISNIFHNFTIELLLKT